MAGISRNKSRACGTISPVSITLTKSSRTNFVCVRSGHRNVSAIGGVIGWIPQRTYSRILGGKIEAVSLMRAAGQQEKSSSREDLP
jgi:hypothetical protein